MRSRTPPLSQPSLRFTVPVPENNRLVGASRWLAVSPDGQDVIVAASGGIFRRSLASVDVTRIPGSEKFESPFYPVFSPDGRSLAFWSPLESAIRTIPLEGGPSEIVARGRTGGMEWTAGGLLLSVRNAIARVNTSTGESQTLFTLPDGELALHPQLIAPDAILFTHLKGDPLEPSNHRSIAVHRLGSGTRTTVVPAGADGRYVPTGHLLYVHMGTLYAARFDVQQLATSGSPVALVSGIRTVGNVNPSAQFGVSPSGTLAYVLGPMTEAGAPLELARFDTSGNAVLLKAPPMPYQTPRVAPDDVHIAVAHDDGIDADVWTAVASGTTSLSRLTHGGRNRFPAWTADSRRIAFQSSREGDLGIFWQPADGTGTAERLTRADPGTSHQPESWSPNNEHLLFTILKNGQHELHVLKLADRQVTPFRDVKSTAPIGATFSPDGRWIAYGVVLKESPSPAALFVQPFPPTGALYQVSRADDGHHPVWSRDGQRLIYIPGPQRLSSLTISTAPRFGFSYGTSLPPAGLMGPPATPRSFDVFKDGSFLGLIPAGATQQPGGPQQVHVVLNWLEELKQRVPVK